MMGLLNIFTKSIRSYIQTNNINIHTKILLINIVFVIVDPGGNADDDGGIGSSSSKSLFVVSLIFCRVCRRFGDVVKYFCGDYVKIIIWLLCIVAFNVVVIVVVVCFALFLFLSYNIEFYQVIFFFAYIWDIFNTFYIK